MGYKEYDPLVGARMNVGCGLIPHSRSTVRFFQAIHFGRTVQSEEIKKLENLVKPNSNTKRGLQVKKESEPVYIP
ncbi:hypothetical protein NADFUDRAFT_82300 [Nadsonia fulvescens var. elongata DSM 6958]|uniref:Uncharacterized protein n=1 Tax=Nadsonia fulvescens var. elongata DSM 6958 TaxID=857566 RepID=A0A1E3PNR0_9ASCO|nr:hypothetical protein NADFUDRAFT_82300 [Nadsonia fulvescens var. elongata DSM 6958]